MNIYSDIPLQLYLLALKRLPLHNMAPVTGGVADGEKNQLRKDFEKQDFKNFEVIVVDQSEPFNEDFYKTFKLDIKFN